MTDWWLKYLGILKCLEVKQPCSRAKQRHREHENFTGGDLLPSTASEQSKWALSLHCLWRALSPSLPLNTPTSKECWLLYNYSNFPLLPASSSSRLLFVSTIKFFFFFLPFFLGWGWGEEGQCLFRMKNSDLMDFVYLGSDYRGVKKKKKHEPNRIQIHRE